MKALAVIGTNLPNNVEDLSRYALIGREKLAAVRAEIRAISKLRLANEVKEQKLLEAQDIAETVLDAETRIGELLRAVPKAQGQRNDIKLAPHGGAKLETPKQQAKQEIGISRKQAEKFVKLAENKPIVEQAKAQARENGEIVTRQAVFNAVAKPHISHNSGNNEWYTPQEYIDAACSVMGEIDLDPASCEIANRVVKAKKFYSADENGLTKPWSGNIWLNPPYAGELIPQFCDKLKNEVDGGNTKQAIVLVNNATETAWFNTLISIGTAVVFPRSRVKFYMPDGKTGAPLQGQAVIYIGDNPSLFMQVFSPFGWGAFIER